MYGNSEEQASTSKIICTLNIFRRQNRRTLRDQKVLLFTEDHRGPNIQCAVALRRKLIEPSNAKIK